MTPIYAILRNVLSVRRHISAALGETENFNRVTICPDGSVLTTDGVSYSKTDVCRAIIHAINTDEMRSNIYNVGAVSVTKMELCRKIKDQVPHFSYYETGKTPKDQWGHDPDQRNYIVSDAKIRATGFNPNVTLEEGIRELLMGYRMILNSRYSNV